MLNVSPSHWMIMFSSLSSFIHVLYPIFVYCLVKRVAISYQICIHSNSTLISLLNGNFDSLKFQDVIPASPLATSIALKSTRHVFVKHRWPLAATKSKYGKNLFESYILTPPHPQGHVMSVKCEEPIDEFTVQVWLLYHHPNFKYCTLFVSGTELRTDGRMNGQTIRLLDAPGGPFRPGA